MIVCSCNFLSDAQVKSAIAGAAPRPRVSRVYASLGCTAKCGRCAYTIKNMLEEIRSYVAPENRAIETITAL
jgi:bacterioferritin-associated ferredoxin